MIRPIAPAPPRTTNRRRGLVPANRALAEIDVNLLCFEEFLNAVQAQFAAVAALFVASPGRLDIARLHGVHPNDAGPKALHHAHASENISRPDGCRETVRCIV